MCYVGWSNNSLGLSDTYIYFGKLIILGSDNGLLPGRHQAITWTNAGIHGNKLQWNFNWNSYIFIQENAFENVVCEMAPNLSRPQCDNSLLWISKWPGPGSECQWGNEYQMD